MSKVCITKSKIIAIADAIRARNDTSEQMKLSDMPTTISEIGCAKITLTTTSESLLGTQVNFYLGNTLKFSKNFSDSGTLTANIKEYGNWLIKYGNNAYILSKYISPKQLADKTSWTYEVNPYENHVFAFKIDKADSNPLTNVHYIEGYQNENYTSAFMDYENDAFDYGDWSSAWFITGCKPCMVTYEGVVDYYLDPNDYTKKIDGVTASDIANTNYNGNAMVEIPLVWTKWAEDAEYIYCYIADHQVDADYHAYAHTNADGQILPFIYISCYNSGGFINSKSRSLSGRATQGNNAYNFVAAARLNNTTDFVAWDVESYADRQLINALLTLIGKTTNTQYVFGNGKMSTSGGNTINSGTMDNKGLFWGSTQQTDGVKVFGIENYWANQWRWVNGLINDKGTIKVKWTHGIQDGSVATDYNFDGTDYLTVTGATFPGSSDVYIKTQTVTTYGLIPTGVSGGSSSTYYTDGLLTNNSQNNFALCGGSSLAGFCCGAWAVFVRFAPSNSDWSDGAVLSCKPRLTV